MKIKRKKIKRYHSGGYGYGQRGPSRKRWLTLVLCLAVLLVLGFGVLTVAKNSKTAWRVERRGRYFVSSTTRDRVKGLYQIEGSLYYFDQDGILQTGWVRQDDYVGYAASDGKLAQGETEVDGTSYYFQPETGQLYTGWQTLDGTTYCFDETGHRRTGVYQEDGGIWQLNDDGSVKSRLNGWRTENGVRKFYDQNGAPAQGWTQIGDRSYFFVDGVSQTGWVTTDEGPLYLTSDGSRATGWNVIDGQPYFFTEEGALQQGWVHAHGRHYYFIDGISKAGTYQEGVASYTLNGSGSIEPVSEIPPEEAELIDSEGEGEVLPEDEGALPGEAAAPTPPSVSESQATAQPAPEAVPEAAPETAPAASSTASSTPAPEAAPQPSTEAQPEAPAEPTGEGAAA